MKTNRLILSLFATLFLMACKNQKDGKILDKSYYKNFSFFDMQPRTSLKSLSYPCISLDSLENKLAEVIVHFSATETDTIQLQKSKDGYSYSVEKYTEKNQRIDYMVYKFYFQDTIRSFVVANKYDSTVVDTTICHEYRIEVQQKDTIRKKTWLFLTSEFESEFTTDDKDISYSSFSELEYSYRTMKELTEQKDYVRSFSSSYTYLDSTTVLLSRGQSRTKLDGGLEIHVPAAREFNAKQIEYFWYQYDARFAN